MKSMLVSAAVGFVLVAVAVGLGLGAPEPTLLLFRHAETTGRLVRTFPTRHGLTEIAYSVHGTNYRKNVPSYRISAAGNDERMLIQAVCLDSDRVAATCVSSASGQHSSGLAGCRLNGPPGVSPHRC